MKTLTFEQTFRPTSITGEDLDSDHPWNTFFREARGDIPVAIAEPVEEGRTDTSSTVVDAEAVAVVDSSKQSAEAETSTNEENSTGRTPGKGCFYLEGLVGSILAIAASSIVFALELAGALVYCIAAGFYKLGSEDSVVPALFKAVFMLVVHILLLVDVVCLFCSVLVRGILWTINWLLY